MSTKDLLVARNERLSRSRRYTTGPAHQLAKQANEVGKGGKSDGLQVDNVDALIDAVRGRKLK